MVFLLTAYPCHVNIGITLEMVYLLIRAITDTISSLTNEIRNPASKLYT